MAWGRYGNGCVCWAGHVGLLGIRCLTSGMTEIMYECEDATEYLCTINTQS